jgi:carbonic anhydrase
VGHPDDVIAYLAAGNARFVEGSSTQRDYVAEREATFREQRPIATVLGCIDSRMPIQEVFDCGLGDLMVVRTAGHILDEAAAHSVAFTVEELGVGAIVVLGHTNCAALAAATAPGGAGSAADWIGSRVRLSLIGVLPDEPHAAEKVHARETARRVSDLNAVREGIARGDLVVRPAIYDLESGVVTWL